MSIEVPSTQDNDDIIITPETLDQHVSSDAVFIIPGLDRRPQALEPLAKYIANKLKRVVIVLFDNSIQFTLAQSVNLCNEKIRRYVNNGYDSKLSLVGFSRGGLIARGLLIKSPAQFAHTITVATPHLGTPFANYLIKKYNDEIRSYKGPSLVEIQATEQGTLLTDYFNNVSSVDNIKELATIAIKTASKDNTWVKIFGEDFHDTRVPVISALAPQLSRKSLIISGLDHSQIEFSATIANQIITYILQESFSVQTIKQNPPENNLGQDSQRFYIQEQHPHFSLD